jgi:hypothetical protein
MYTMKDINAEIKKLLAERDAALRSLAVIQCHPRLAIALEDRTYQFYESSLKQLEARFAVAEYWQGQAAPNNGVQPTDDAAKIVDENQVVIGG